MPSVKCPVCLTRLHFVHQDVVLTPRQKAILNTIPEVRRRKQKPVVYPKDIAVDLGWSARTIRRELNTLEQLGEVRRPDGPRSGWVVVEQPVMREMKVAV